MRPDSKKRWRRPSRREIQAALAHTAQLQSGNGRAPVNLTQLRARFWSYVQKPYRGPDGEYYQRALKENVCWSWLGGVNAWGYGYFRIGTKMLRAHRVAYLLTYGTIPAGALILHSCDNRLCCNPAHLRAGTQSENVRDEWARYRKPAEKLGLLITRTRPNGHAR